MATNVLTTDQLSYQDIVEHLGDDSGHLLDFNSPKIPGDMIHVPGPDFVDRIYADTNRNAQVLRSLSTIFGNGRLANSGYLSILPVDQGIEHTGGASFAPRR